MNLSQDTELANLADQVDGKEEMEDGRGKGVTGREGKGETGGMEGVRGIREEKGTGKDRDEKDEERGKGMKEVDKWPCNGTERDSGHKWYVQSEQTLLHKLGV